jgi:hypothetical protein
MQRRSLPSTNHIVIIGLLVVAVLILFLSVARGESSAAAPLLAYPVTAPTPTLGQPPAIAAPALASGETTLLSPTDLLAGWQVVDTPPTLPGEAGRWILQDGLLVQDGIGPAASLSAAYTALLSPDAYQDVTITTTFADTRNGAFGLIARSSAAGAYRVRLHADPSYDGEALVLEKVIDGVGVPLVLNAGEPLYTPRTWHTLSLSVQGEMLRVTLDGQLVAQAVDAAPLPAGQVGLVARALGGIAFSQVAIQE